MDTLTFQGQRGEALGHRPSLQCPLPGSALNRERMKLLSVVSITVVWQEKADGVPEENLPVSAFMEGVELTSICVYNDM